MSPLLIEGTPAAVLQHSKALRKELRVVDLALMQVLLVVYFGWLGIAAKQGPTHVFLWILAILLYYLPLGAVVVYLSRLMPLEGGAYQWVKLGLNPFAGFMAAWNFWTYALVGTAALGLTVAGFLKYAIGPSGAWISENGWSINALNIAVLGVILFVNIRGLHVAKWLTNAAGVMNIGLFATLIILLLLRLSRGPAPANPPFSPTMPAVTLSSVNLFSKIAFNALGGLEQVAVFAGECRDPSRGIARSVMIAAPLIALMYILGTGSVLAHVDAGKIDLIATVPQVLRAAVDPSGTLAWIGGLTIAVLTAALVITYIVLVAEVSRLPMVAGWDGLLPDWFTRLHPQYRTPSRSIWFAVICCFVLGVVSLTGVREQEAFQILTAASLGCSGVYSALLFSVSIWGMQSFAHRPRTWLRLAAASGLGVAALSIAFQLFPIIHVSRPLVFGAKVGVTVAVANIGGILLYWRGRKQTRSVEAR